MFGLTVTRFIRAFLLTMLCLGILSSLCMAASTHELTYFKSYETTVDGEEVIRFELGLNRDGLAYKESTKAYRPNTLILDLDDTIPGRLRHQMQLSGIGESLKVQEVELKHTRLQLNFTKPVEELSYRVYTLSENRKERKPARLVIDVSKRGKKAAGSTEGVEGHTIVLDAGHGGSDTGAIGPSGLTEKEVTLAVTQKVRDILENSGAHVVMTRDSDRDVYGVNATDRQELQARVDVSLREPATEIFVSVHCNAFSSPSAHGVETYYYAGSPLGYRLAALLDEELLRAGGLQDRGVKDANFYVLRHSAVPASLVELAFITNYQEEQLLADEGYQSGLAEAIARAIGRYFSGN